MALPALSDWQVELLRVTAFTKDVVPPSHCDELWNKVVGADAETVARKPALATYSASGPVGSASLTLNVNPGRIDWLLAPTGLEPLFEAALGHFASQDDELGDRLMSWLQFPSITVTRLAIGEVVRLPVPTRVEAYKTLAKLLPKIAPDPSASRDFMYQINRPRESQVIPGLVVNRLSKWAAMELKVGLMGTTKPSASMDFVRLELDISTDKDSERDLSKDKKLDPLYRELARTCREIVTNGDIA